MTQDLKTRYDHALRELLEGEVVYAPQNFLLNLFRLSQFKQIKVELSLPDERRLLGHIRKVEE